MLLGDLVADADLGLRWLTPPGEDRPIRGVYVTDLLDPRRYLHGGELVLSGLMWWTGEESSERFVSALAEAGVAAVACGTARLGDTPPDLVTACERHGVPAVQVPLSVSFNTLAERVQPHAAPRRELMAAVAAGADLNHVLALAGGDTGTDCWVLSAVGAQVAGSAALSEEVCARLAAELPRRHPVPCTVRVPAAAGSPRGGGPSGEAFLLWPVDTGDAVEAARWWVVVRRGDDAEGREAVAADVATVVALVRSRVDQARRIAGRAVQAVLPGLLDGTAGAAEATARLESIGMSAGDPVRAVSLTAGDSARSAALLRELAAAAGTLSVTAPLDEAAVTLFSADGGDLSDLDVRLRGLVDAAAARWHADIAVGISGVQAATELRAAVEEAAHARRLVESREAAASGADTRVATAEELRTHDVLLASVPEDLRRSYRARLLGQLHDYDAAHHSELVRTLDEFLACSGSWARCAQRLHVHVNTLRYRLRRIEQLTGRDLGAFATRVDFYLALRLERTAS
ncbi:helix-turn-helix domain-containing protein [Salinifilum aidingensis]